MDGPLHVSKVCIKSSCVKVTIIPLYVQIDLRLRLQDYPAGRNERIM